MYVVTHTSTNREYRTPATAPINFQGQICLHRKRDSTQTSMRIESLVIDGFKSYAVRTEVTFDPTFTAITGLNGSGKSNILDSICFVLGITNMSTLRAQNLQDLIYKRGQAGVTKASVTIVFANDVKKTAPVGFSPEDFPTISVTRQIMMGGTSKYLINGHRAQQQTVQNLFQSVQLNINNPNFLIMQGKITKVLNMKPMEILSMIEEAAGTRMFEERKDKAIKNIAKKEAKVQEINALLAEEIEPKLEKLRTEKRAWLEFQQVQSELERATRLVVAYDYTRLNDKVSRAATDLEQKKADVDKLESDQTRLKQEIANIEQDIKEINGRREKEMRKGGKFSKLEKDAKELSHELVRLATNLELKQGSIQEDSASLLTAQSALKELQKQVGQRSKEFEKSEKAYNKLKDRYDTLNSEYTKKDELLQTLSTGFSAKEGQDSGYLDLLADAQNRVSQANTEQQQAKIKIAHYEKRLKEDEPKVKAAKTQNATLIRDLEDLRQASAAIEKKLTALGLDPESYAGVVKRQKELRETIKDLTGKADTMKKKVANIDFTYTDPTPNFDRRQVKGLIAQLFTLDEKNFASATALEICAGGRLYNVVVENEKVGSMLLSHGKLRKRVTIIPLNKISAFKASAEKLGAAKRLAPGKVDLALSLIGYDDEVTAAMEYVFGSTLICADAETAKKVTFDKAVNLKSVTLDGDVYDPSGTLSGGSKPNSSGVLVTLQKLNEVNTALNTATSELEAINTGLAKSQGKMQESGKLQQQLELKQHEIKLTEEQINNNSNSRIVNEVEEMKSGIVELKEAIILAKTNQDQAKADIKTIEKDMSEFKNNKNGKLSALQKEVDQLKAVLSKESAAVKAQQKSYQALQIDLDQLNGDLTAALAQVEENTSSLESQKAEIAALQQQHDNVKDQHDILEAELADERAKMTGFDQELAELDQASRDKTNQISDHGLAAQQIRHEIDRFAKETQASEQSLRALLKDHDWIPDSVSDFSKPGSIYDSSKMNITEVKQSMRQLSEKHNSMKKRVNAKVMNTIDGVEKKESSLRQMVRTIHKDKLKIEETILSLDEYKLEALTATWQKVTVDFGTIFNDLLPGNTAKLVPLEGKDVTGGLEVKVNLGGVWKLSLTELSGGQRSLIALSLIMSLLQYKPAPMYILDEVDAALDLSHTQNIGSLIKSRFKGSQFIVVSLKEGMFTNANKILRTRFSENTSLVS